MPALTRERLAELIGSSTGLELFELLRTLRGFSQEGRIFLLTVFALDSRIRAHLTSLMNVYVALAEDFDSDPQSRLRDEIVMTQEILTVLTELNLTVQDFVNILYFWMVKNLSEPNIVS